MVLSAPVIALGATLGTATSILALCGLTCLCKCKRSGKGPSDKEQDLDTENAKPSVLQTVQQFNIEKTAEPVQPRTILKFPHIYGPKPVVTSSEIVNYPDYTLKTTEQPAKNKPATLDEKRMNIRVNEELFIHPQTGGMKDVCVTKRLSPEEIAGCDQVPELRYSLGYNHQEDVLCVASLEVMYGSIVGDQNNSCDCYVMGTLVSRSGTIEAQTVLKKQQQHITWEEALLLPIKEEELPEGVLTLTLRNCDKFSRHSIVGEMKPSLVNVGEPYGTAQWEKLKTLKKNVIDLWNSLPQFGAMMFDTDVFKKGLGQISGRKIHCRLQAMIATHTTTTRLKFFKPERSRLTGFRVMPQFLLRKISTECCLCVIGDKDSDEGYGEVLLSISYLPATNRLLVVLIKAKNLHSKQLKELLGKDISVKVTLKHQSLKLKKKQTKRAKHKINPVWNEMIMFEVPHDLLCASSVELEMLSQDGDGQNHLLGKCSLGLHAAGTERNHWEEMLRNPRRQIAMWHQLHM